MQSPVLLAVMLSAVVSAANAVPVKLCVHVSPNGDDAAQGTEEAPCRTLAGAFSRVRLFRAQAAFAPQNVAEIRLAPGTYRISATLTLGTADSHLRIVGTPGETVLSGGMIFPRFKVCKGGLWSLPVKGLLPFEQLWVNGERATRAREPDEGFFLLRDALDDDSRGFIAYSNDIAPIKVLTPEERSRIVFHRVRSWDVSRRLVGDFCFGSNGEVIAPTKGWRYHNWNAYPPRYWLENYRVALDTEGEWFLDALAGELLYRPRKGENPNETVAEAPIVSQWLCIKGTPQAPVKDISFEGLAFDLAGEWLSPAGEGGQSANGVDGSIRLEYAHGVRLDRCQIRRTGLYGLAFRRGCVDSSVESTLIEDVGAGAIRLGEGNVPVSDADRVSRIRIVNNILRHGGRLAKAGTGIFVQQADGCEISHNEIADFYYSGISMGWTWGYGPTAVRNNRISWNHIHHLGHGYLSDMSGIYTLGDCTGSEVVGNVIHDVVSGDYAGTDGCGLYADEGSRGIVFASNLVYRTSIGFYQHYGRDNVVRNNIFVDPTISFMSRRRDENHFSFFFEHNVCSSTEYVDSYVTPALSGTNVCAKFLCRDNVFFIRESCLGAFCGMTLDDWKSVGEDVGSIVGDPRFVDPDHDDYRLRSDSPAFKLGFEGWNHALAGVTGDAEWRALAATRCPRMVPLPIPVYGDSRSADFEAPACGIRPFAGCCGKTTDGRKGEISVVSDGTGHALRVRAVPGLKPEWAPSLDATIRASGCCAVTEFSLRADPRLRLQIEWRDYAPEKVSAYYVVGGCLRISNGKLTVQDYVVDLPKSGKIGIRAVHDLTKKPAAICFEVCDGERLLAKIPARPAKGFHVISALQFVTTSDVEGVWFLDDFRFETRK